MGLSLTVRNVNPLQNQNHLSKHRPLWRLSVSAVLWTEHFQAKPPQARRHSALYACPSFVSFLSWSPTWSSHVLAPSPACLIQTRVAFFSSP